jgi:DNA-binding NarL/FixJ family response regulator
MPSRSGDPALFESNKDALGAVRRWLALNRDVIVTGDVGSGRSLLLAELLYRSVSRASAVLLRAAGDGPLAAFHAQPSFAQSGVGPTVTDATAWLMDEVGGHKGTLLVDDLDQLDPDSAAVVARVLRATGAALVATTRSARLHDVPAPLALLVPERAPAVERLVSLGFDGIYHLVAEELGGPVDLPLASAVLSSSGGNPRVALALTTAARHIRVIDREGGIWRKIGQFDDVPGDAVVNALLGAASDEEVRALELLSWVGPVRDQVAAALVERPLLTRLQDVGRVVEHPSGSGTEATITVSPPALGAALRDRVGPADAHDMARFVTGRVGSAVPLPYLAERDVGVLLQAGDRRAELDYHRWSTEIADLALADAAAAEAVLHREWQLTPTVRVANAYLDLLMRRPARPLLHAVFTRTEITGDEPESDLLQFCVQRARWAAWEGLPADQTAALPFADDPRVVRVLAQLVGRRRAVLDALEPTTETWPAPECSGLAWVDAWSVVAVAGALLDAGRPDLALPLIDRVGEGATGDAEHDAEALRTLCLLMLDRVDEAESWSRHLLERAYQARDLTGVRVHAAALTEVLTFAGRRREAWRVLNTSLSLGSPGPAGTSFYRRGLALGTAVQAIDPEDNLVAPLAREIADAATTDGVLGGMEPIALAARDRDAGHDLAAARRLEQAAARATVEGRDACAVMLWLARDMPPSTEIVGAIDAAVARGRMPVFEPYLRLARAVLTPDPAEVALALPRVSRAVAPGLVARAHELLRRGTEERPVVPAAPVEVVPVEAAHHDDQVKHLTSREREVAMLARRGLTNKEIAVRLVLSIRTVENHMAAVLKKLGVNKRSGLRSWTFTDG